MSTAGDELQARIETLLRAGVERWDAPGLSVVRQLLQRAQDCGPALREHLQTRASAHLDQLELGFAAARTRAEVALAHLVQRSAEPARLQAKLDGGAFDELQRLVRRPERSLPATPSAQLAERRARLEQTAQRRGITPAAAKGSAPDSAALASALYRDSAAAANARRTVARATAAVPNDAGHYNAHRIAARALQTLSRHPAYLKAQLARLETLALLQPAPEPKPKPARKRKRSEAGE